MLTAYQIIIVRRCLYVGICYVYVYIYIYNMHTVHIGNVGYKRRYILHILCRCDWYVIDLASVVPLDL